MRGPLLTESAAGYAYVIAANSAAAADDAYAGAAKARGFTDAGDAACTQATQAAAYAIRAAAAFSGNGHAPDAAAKATAAAAAALAATSATSADAWSAIRFDASLLKEGTASEELARRPLWPDGAPQTALRHWERLKAALPKAERWQDWIKWNERRLNGTLLNEAAESVFVDITVEEWKRGRRPAGPTP